MKLLPILEKYDTVLLDQISADKVDEAITLRLPQSVIIQEIISALSSQSYISNKILYGKPPTFGILNLILQSPDFMAEVEGFRAKVLDYVRELSARAAENKTSQEKNQQLYIKILRKAWENDSQIDKSEAHILELVKQELGIWDREHFALMHDESILSLWDVDQEYYLARNQLLTTGILLTYENTYVIADEVAAQIRKAFGIEIMDDSYKRLLNSLTNEDLSLALNYYQLNVGGPKDAKVERLMNSLMPPTEILGLFHLESLRELCRRETIQVGGSKNMVIANIIQFFDEDKDLHLEQIDKPEPNIIPEPEIREMGNEIYAKVLMNLTGQQLYDILYQSLLMTSGSKDEKVRRILDSPWSERSVFNHLRKDDLAQLCRKFSLLSSGSKQELVGRVLEYIPLVSPVEYLVRLIILA